MVAGRSLALSSISVANNGSERGGGRNYNRGESNMGDVERQMIAVIIYSMIEDNKMG